MESNINWEERYKSLQDETMKAVAALRAKCDRYEQALRKITGGKVLPYSTAREALEQEGKELIGQQEEADDWISVNDQLPSEGGRYWCYVEETNSLGISHFQWNCCFHDKEKRWSDNFVSFNVTHWRKLPEPPKTKVQRRLTCQLPTGCLDWFGCAKKNGCKGKEVRPEHNVIIGNPSGYCIDCGFPVDECNCIDKDA